MKKLIILAIIILSASICMGAGLLERDGNGHPIQGGSPDDSKTIMLTIVKQTVDLTNDVWWSLYSPTTCKYRIMDTSTVTGHSQHTSPANANTSRVKNQKYPFLNLSGCTSGELQRQ